MRRLRTGEQPTTGPGGITPGAPMWGAYSRRAAPQSGSARTPQGRTCPASLALSGTHGQCLHRPLEPPVSTFLHPFAPRALPRFLATMGVLTPGRLSSPPRSPCFACRTFLTVPPPTTPCLAVTAFARYPSARRLSRLRRWRRRVKASPFVSRLAGTHGRIGFVILRTGRSPPVALHLASRRCSYSRLRAGKRFARWGLSPTLT